MFRAPIMRTACAVTSAVLTRTRPGAVVASTTTVQPAAVGFSGANSHFFFNSSWRSFTSTTTAAMPLDEFRDSVGRQQRMSETVGRSWRAKELRRKSFEDLHKLWLVLYKERNMLLTEQQLSRRKQVIFPQPQRLRKVAKSMGAIRHVLGERKRERIKHQLLESMPPEVVMVDGTSNLSSKATADNADVMEAEIVSPR